MNVIYNFILWIVKPMIKTLAKIHAPFTHKKINGKHYYKLRDELFVGSVLLTNTNGELSNIINPIKIKHAGLYVGDILKDGIRYVAEATGKGVVLTDLVTFLTTKDLVIVCNPKFIVTENRRTGIQERVMNYIGRKYDYYFEKSKDKMYCFELCFHALDNAHLKPKEIVKGKCIFDHNTFLDTLHFNVTFNSEGMIL